ncbi:type I restriction enzyme, S subunit [Albimonas donghaensis]|uniref:Type I restriction enzyme, S subunit n=1 Tax=Albimonas donghaensis TaxID=356660 RepID=A0A1H3FW81_9RHOB|nr:restriction endonuclease subunit S [Albimonas donghaensis]SDX94618.1 type I restriction enzyme, S subunit [Albimonas donghaensis]
MLDHGQRCSLGEICTFTNGNGFRPKDWAKDGLPIIRIQNLNGSQEFNYFDGEPRKNWIVEPGELLFAWAGVKGVSFGPTIWPGPRGVLNQHIYRVTPKAAVDLHWLHAALQLVTRRVEAKSHGFKSSLVHVHKSDITEQVVSVPPLPEQRRIAGILRTWDEAIDAASRLIDAKRRRLDAITFRLVFGGARLANFGDASARQEARWFNVPAAWRVAKIGDLAKEVSRTNADGAVSEVLSCSKHDGFVRSLEYFKKQIFSADLSGYKIIARGDFGFPSNHVEEGSIGLQTIADIGVVSPIYCVFRFDAKKVDADYAFRVLKTSVFRHMFSVATSASVDRRGSLRWKEFRKLPFPVPPLAEQQAIAAAIDLAAQDLATSKAHLDALKRQKRGLMQKLLTVTGAWRAPAEPAV